ncbi:MAG: hypothetical protein KIT14_07195 [bacterium]|nr:hypothetical protein [bacterium]
MPARRLLAVLALLLLPAVAGAAGPKRTCKQLCAAERRACGPALRACLAAADGRAARRSCRVDRQRCRTLPAKDCRRMLTEAVVPEFTDLASCPTTPEAACTNLGPDEPCTDALHPADAYFWDRFHAGDYAAIPSILAGLRAGLAENPDDPSLARHLPWTYIWRLAESARGITAPELLETLRETRPGFARAVTLNAGDARVLGFLAGITLGEGIALNDPALYDEGNALFVQGIAAWPEFNYFSSGYILSQLPRDHPGFRLALEQQWANIDACAGFIVDRTDPDLAATLKRETTLGRLRVCWNSWIAPYNLEGFFMNLGDMLVKDGQVATGVQVYEAARLAENYDSWPYREHLERRIVEAAENAARFDQEPPDHDHAIMFRTTYSCMGCHQAH